MQDVGFPCIFSNGRSRYEAQALYRREDHFDALKQHEGGRTMAELAREHGITENTLYRWKARYGGMEVSEAKRLR